MVRALSAKNDIKGIKPVLTELLQDSSKQGEVANLSMLA